MASLTIADVKIVVDDVEISTVKRVETRRNVSVDADELDFTISNVRNQYTKLFCGVAEKKRKVEVWIDEAKQFSGLVDNVRFGWSLGGEIECGARDMTAKLLDMKVPDEWRDKCKGLTSSQTVIWIAQETGFLCKVKETSKVWPAGSLWKNTSSVWDVIKALAKREGFLAYLNHRGSLANTIIFRPLGGGELSPSFVFDKEAGHNGHPLKNPSFSIDRADAVAKVTVQTYDAKGKIIKATATPDKAPEDGAEIVVTDNSLKDKTLAELRAEAVLADRMRGMVTGSFGIAYTEQINPEDKIKLSGFDGSGSGPGLDGVYYVVGVTDSLSSDGSNTQIEFSAQLDYQVELETEEKSV